MGKKTSKILIIENNKKKQIEIKDQVDKITKEIYISSKGAQALNDIEKYNPDLVILDLFLGDISGYELTRLIKNNYNIPVITLTNNSQIAPFIRAHQEGADACLFLPFKQKELQNTIKKLL
ncbi:MAG: response regulator [Spirochaetes bacterium]|nr:response regulator [Spirochaetota bacterium]